ncbi:prepilin peptidase [bacterium]|nr:prepilin peptidase [bacterium]
MNFDPILLLSPVAIGVGLMGLLFGSLANVLIYRIPRDLPLGMLAGYRSRCPECSNQIKIFDNIPLLSYVFLLGKCRACNARIPFRYFFIELLVPVLLWFSSAVLLQANGPEFQGELSYWAWFLLELYFVYTLLVIVVIDVDFRIIPDRFSIGNWVIALVMISYFENFSFPESFFGGLFGFGIFWLLAWGYEKYKGIEGLGFGDVKMMGWLGTWLGFAEVPPLILIASTSGLLAGLWAMRKGGDGMKTAIPFGPFLALGAFLMWIKIKLSSGL